MRYLKYLTTGVLLASSLFAKEIPGSTDWNIRFSPKLASDGPAYSLINIGNFGYWQKEDAYSAHTPAGNSGGIYPRGTAANIYLDGVLTGGYDSDGVLHVSGTIYRNGMVKGYIDANGDIQNGDEVRIYRIRKDWETLTYDQVRLDAAEIYETTVSAVTDAQIQDVIDQYETDWENWPTDLGAPFYDLDGDGVYEPNDGETPGIADADQVMWYVATDADETTTSDLYGCTPIGLEQQLTLWGYNQPGAALGQIIFKNIRLINKGSSDLSDAYISLWADPDVGDYTNDLVGVDTTLSLMFSYNGVADDDDYSSFGLAPAAVGYDFFAGPIVESAGDTAIFNLKKRPGYRNLPASSFGYFVAGGVYSDPGPYGDTEAAREYYNLMRGFAPVDDLANPTPWLDADGNETKFPFAGDPVTGEGDLDSGPADRRMLINAGPFTLAVGDTQDIVTAVIGGIGDSYLSSITDVKNTDLVAQTLFDDLFSSVPSAPPAPVVTATAFEDQVLLDWSDMSGVQATESSIKSGYAFQGYNVYQLPNASSSRDDAYRVATFDLVDGVQTIYGNVFLPEYGEKVSIPVQFGLDKGIKRQLVISEDFLTGGPLYAGSEYYFAVTAYNYNDAPALIEDQALETALTPLYVQLTPQAFGTEFGAAGGDAVSVSHEGPSQGIASATVVNPAALTGETYNVTFTDDTSYVHVNGDTVSGTLWTLSNVTASTTPVTFYKQASSQSDFDQPIVDGVQVVVSGPELGIVAIEEYGPWPNGTLIDGSIDSHLSISLSQTGLIMDNRAGDVNLPSYARDYDRFDYWGMDDIIIDFGDESITWDYIHEGVHRGDANGDGDSSEVIMTPFAVYRIKFATGDTIRLFAGFWDTNGDGAWSVNYDEADSSYDWVAPTYGAECWEPIYCWQGYDADGNEISYDPANESQYDTDDALSTSANITWGASTGEFTYPYITATLVSAYYGPNEAGNYEEGSSGGGTAALPAAGNYDKYGAQLSISHYFKFTTAKANSSSDTFTFTTPTSTASDSAAAADLDKINVFPNPYYAFNSQETNRFDHFVTFNHLPDDGSDVTVKIYSIDGVMVRKLESAANADQYMRWDLRNSNDLPVASGPYVAHVKAGDHGERVLKLYIVQRNQVVQYY